MVKNQVDILIVGGGLTGATLSLALHGLGVSSLLIDAKPLQDKINPDFDARSLALSPASQRILNMLGLWETLEQYATPIEMIHVSDQHRFGASRLQAEKNRPLGYVIEMQFINLALSKRLDKEQMRCPATVTAIDLAQSHVTVQTQTGEEIISAQLIVAADGTDSHLRHLCGLSASIKEYNQCAIVANVGLAKPHEFKAFERFTTNGPLALLPMQDHRMSLVWALTPNDAKQLMSLNDAEFLKQLQNAFGYRLGRFVKIGKRHTFPLSQVIMPQQTKWPVVFVGNAAHTLHPVAGQGFNLGLRDVATLAQCIAANGLSSNMLEQYLQLRKHDQQSITALTDGLIQLFTKRIPGIGVARNLGMIAFDNLPPLKKLFARYARGFGGVIPDLVCEIALNGKEVQ
ncbi:2-octaprenyl-6-methoxyphenyl hydroxylase [Legionella waltersii]|uniref:2-octaprenyl-6-methoxyphenol hydroxylase n=1 Tax=Legionella waltersii TaxID=66969 RepID=A0A0W1A5D2_9GAMM|nr:2-octaprenyl-6-methoxyphenyl hydroxylase [Legionella waltersii]KTD76538.1 2-octaprenyl-6-methoxyphenol hydroxylase [Legionella waltersii]SNU94009.1 2-octaprenyl-6-methoxyphenol hydroxylase [Legionella waltersii]